MKNECFDYALNRAKELESLYSGEEFDGYSDLWDYLADNALDVEYILDSSRELIGVCLYITLGGPTCWIDTRRQSVVCHWGSDSAECGLASDVCDYINDIERDMFNCL